MALFLVQHGKALPKEIDPEQGLSDEGRAAQTADIFAAALKPPEGVQKRDGLNPLDNVAAAANRLDASEELMIVGHLPFMERMASLLITGAMEKPVIRFQNSGIVCLDRDAETGHWTIRWTLFPRIG